MLTKINYENNSCPIYICLSVKEWFTLCAFKTLLVAQSISIYLFLVWFTLYEGEAEAITSDPIVI